MGFFCIGVGALYIYGWRRLRRADIDDPTLRSLAKTFSPMLCVGGIIGLIGGVCMLLFGLLGVDLADP